MRQVDQAADIPGRAVAGGGNIDSRGQLRILVDRDPRPTAGRRSGDVEVPVPVGAWVYEPELSPENTTVRAEPLEVVRVKPLVSSWPFSMTSTAPAGALIVTLPISC